MERINLVQRYHEITNDVINFSGRRLLFKQKLSPRIFERPVLLVLPPYDHSARDRVFSSTRSSGSNPKNFQQLKESPTDPSCFALWVLIAPSYHNRSPSGSQQWLCAEPRQFSAPVRKPNFRSLNGKSRKDKDLLKAQRPNIVAGCAENQPKIVYTGLNRNFTVLFNSPPVFRCFSVGKIAVFRIYLKLRSEPPKTPPNRGIDDSIRFLLSMAMTLLSRRLCLHQWWAANLAARYNGP